MGSNERDCLQNSAPQVLHVFYDAKEKVSTCTNGTYKDLSYYKKT